MPWLLITQPSPRDQAALTKALVTAPQSNGAMSPRGSSGHRLRHQDWRIELAEAANAAAAQHNFVVFHIGTSEPNKTAALSRPYVERTEILHSLRQISHMLGPRLNASV